VRLPIDDRTEMDVSGVMPRCLPNLLAELELARNSLQAEEAELDAGCRCHTQSGKVPPLAINEGMRTFLPVCQIGAVRTASVKPRIMHTGDSAASMPLRGRSPNPRHYSTAMMVHRGS
jgi:hypothetical protein